ncbi:helix-turn-helix domain-containing protein [Streptomyces sp. NPDC007259]|uniref:helix-turn-helix domain-containing protein n=1 Tax=Streptomyces sp. NPDC007259 TaxID=3154319 RepID=UPI003451D2AE
MNRDPEAWARLGRALRTAREQRRLSQDELADLAGVSTGSVQSLESGTVPKARVPITLSPVAQALGWPAGAAADVLEGEDPPASDGEWRDAPVPQQQLDEERVAGIMTNAMVRATEHATAAEIRAATKIALDELRRQGLLSETNSVQPSSNPANP